MLSRSERRREMLEALSKLAVFSWGCSPEQKLELDPIMTHLEKAYPHEYKVYNKNRDPTQESLTKSINKQSKRT